MTLSLRITPFVKWADLWVGAYVDRDKRAVYLCPLPCVGLKVEWGEPKKPTQPARCNYCGCEVSDAEFFGNHSRDFGHCCDPCLSERRAEESELRDDGPYDDRDDEGPSPLDDGGDYASPFDDGPAFVVGEGGALVG